ncbi:MAG: hypothetical protein WA981_09830 [Glaciecola sp.]
MLIDEFGKIWRRILHVYTPVGEGLALILGGAIALLVRSLAITQNLSMPAHKGLQ